MRSPKGRGPASGVLVVALTVAATMLLPVSAAHAAPPNGFRTSLVIGAGLDGPTGFDIAPDGRVFILERAGKIKIVKDGVLLSQPFAELPSAATGDRGLIGLAFDPAFGIANHDVYFYYTGLDLLNHVVRFDASADLAAGAPQEVFRTASPSQLLHVGGSLAFGPDGKLYLAIGDNGYPANSQDLSNPHGKVLRINKDGSIPSDNPFVGRPGAVGAIWAYGFRNPWRMQFDRTTGTLYAGDVGDFTWEELNRVVVGANYGWPVKEGVCQTGCAGFVDPIHAYNHDGQSSAITAGAVYRASMYPADYTGRLFFGDYARGFLRTARLDGSGNVAAVQDFDSTAGSVVDMKVDRDGSLLYLTYYPGELYRVVYDTGSHVPVAQATIDVTKGIAPMKVRFSSAGSSDPDGDPLSYHWDFGDGTSSTAANPRKTYRNKGVFTVRLTVSDGHYQATARPIVVQVGVAPTLIVSAPVDGALYRAGDTITYNAAATDAAGFDLDDAAITTEVRFHHGTHFHPFLGPVPGRVGSFTIPTTGEAAADTWYEIIVTATDTNGLSTTRSVAIRPRIAQINLVTDPAGLVLLLDGVPVGTPLTVDGVVGFQREIAAPATAVGADGRVYEFRSWSDAGPIRHTIVTEESGTTRRANYALSTPFTGEYFNNPNLSGPPVLTRADPQINFTWWLDAPDPRIPVDGFSVRWSKTHYFGAGRYRFATTTDDGVRLYIDGQRVIDRWQDQSTTTVESILDLPAGDHTVVMEYYDNSWDAIAMLTWDSTR